MSKVDVSLVKNFTSTTSIDLNGAAVKPAASTVGWVGNYTFVANSVTGAGVGEGNAINLTISGTAADHSWNITGSTGADTLTGGNGNDTLISGGGQDVLVGGSGSDLFMIKAATAVANTVTLSDYTYGEDSVYLENADVANVVKEGMASNFTSAGLVKDASVNKISNYALASEELDGFYKVSVKNATGDLTNVWFAGAAASTMDASSETKAAVMIGSDNSESDTIIGGAGKDTILAGAGDYAYGGAGNDLIKFVNTTVAGGSTADDDKKETAVILSGAGADTVEGFSVGTAAANDTVYLYDTTVDKASFQYNGKATGNLTVTDGSASLFLSSIETHEKDFVGLAVEDSSGTTYNVAVAGAVTGNSTITVTGKDALYDYYEGAAGNKSVVDFTADTKDLVVDLGNTGVFEDNATFSNITTVKGGSGNNTLVGGVATADVLQATTGASTLWGGGSASDTLIGGTSTDTFVYGDSQGNDVIKEFTVADDRLAFIGNGGVSSITRNTSNVALTWSDGGTLTIVGATDKDAAVDFVVGSSEYKAKIGVTGAVNELTYDKDVNFYIGSTKTDTLHVTDSDNDQIWLSSTDKYSSIDNIDASSAQGSVVLAGGDTANKILGGVGASSLWGGTGAVSDTLVGGTGTNTFYFGKGEGNDYITSSTSSDKVVLYDVALTDIASAAVKNGAMVVTLTDGSSLTLASYDSANKVTNYQLSDGTTWTYNTTDKKWAQA